MHFTKRRDLAKKFERWRRVGNRQIRVPGAEITRSPFNVISFLDGLDCLVDADATKTDEELAVHLLRELEAAENKCGSNLYKYRSLVKRVVAKWQGR